MRAPDVPHAFELEIGLAEGGLHGPSYRTEAAKRRTRTKTSKKHHPCLEEQKK